jgi:hypothetical protein
MSKPAIKENSHLLWYRPTAKVEKTSSVRSLMGELLGLSGGRVVNPIDLADWHITSTECSNDSELQVGLSERHIFHHLSFYE